MERQSLLRTLLETQELGVSAITIEYFLPADAAAGTQPQPRDAYWDVTRQRLLLRDNVDSESLRDAAAKSIATEFFGEATSADLQSEFFRLLMASMERARKLMSERSNWRLSTEQQQWLCEQDWTIAITEMDEAEQPEPPRPPTPLSPTTTAPAAVTKTPSTPTQAVSPQEGTATPTNQNSPADSGQGGSSRADTNTPEQVQHADVPPARNEPLALHDANITTADFAEVRAHTRPRTQRTTRQQTREEPHEPTGGLSTTSADNKAALEKCGRDFVSKKLTGMGYSVTSMPQSNPGFDLKAEKTGEVIKVEVKAHAGEASSVFVTQREWVEYLRTRDVGGEMWELWNVENLAKSLGKTPTIQRIRHIPKSAMKESGHWIDLKQCSPEIPPVRPSMHPQQ